MVFCRIWVFDVLFLDVRYNLDNCRSKRSSFGRMNAPICLFDFVINSCHVFGIIFFFRKKTIEHSFRSKVWLYGFESVFWPVLIDFLLLSICCSFCNHASMNNWIPTDLFHKNIGNCKPIGHFSWFLMVFMILNLIVFKNYRRTFQLYCFCSLLSNCYQALLWTGPIYLLAN